MRLSVHATTAVSAALCTAFPVRPVLSHYPDLDWRELSAGQDVVADGQDLLADG